MEEDNWKPIQPELWKPEQPGDEISGVLLGVDSDIGKFKSKVYHLETEQGKQLNFFGSTVIDDKTKYVRVGNLIKIVFKGKKIGENGQEYNDFDVFKKEGKK